MAETHCVHALYVRRDKIVAAILKYEAQLLRAQHDLAHVNAALHLFTAEGEPQDYPSYVDLRRIYRRGETTRYCLEALRADGPLDTRELTLRVLRAKGLDETDAVLRNGVAFRVIHALSRLALRGQVVKECKRKRAFVWRLPGEMELLK
jgi:hypothetical protein